LKQDFSKERFENDIVDAAVMSRAITCMMFMQDAAFNERAILYTSVPHVDVPYLLVRNLSV